jgi:hypothetical protein
MPGGVGVCIVSFRTARPRRTCGGCCRPGPQPAPQRHRLDGAAQSVASILSNPRYTGRQVWNRQHTDPDPHDRPGVAEWRRWNPTQHGSCRRTHHTGRWSANGTSSPPKPSPSPRPRRTAPRGSIRWSDWSTVESAAGGWNPAGFTADPATAAATATSSTPPAQPRPKNLYWRQDHILAHIASDLEHHDQFGATPESPASAARTNWPNTSARNA